MPELQQPEILENRLALTANPPGAASLPVYMHYMPWFETPETSANGEWGWHWTMNTRNPDVIDASGRRDIAAHQYPLIGPYASNDPDVIEYHLHLMKLSGVDGVLINWYGVAGTNGDIDMLLRNSKALIDRLEAFDMEFAVVLEDRFAAGAHDTMQNMAYLRDQYLTHPAYIRDDSTDRPLVLIFGPITVTDSGAWAKIAEEAGEPIDLLSLWYNDRAGGAATGQYAWVYQDQGTTNHLSHLENFYTLKAPSLNVVGGIAYPGFDDFYAEGGAGAGYFEIPAQGGQTLTATLALAAEHQTEIDFLQLVTWNDFGEGTMFEPTAEHGFDALTHIQLFRNAPFSVDDLEVAHALYQARKEHATSPAASAQLDSVAAAIRAGDMEIEEGALGDQQRAFLSSFHASVPHHIAFTRDSHGLVRALRFRTPGPAAPAQTPAVAVLPRSARGPAFAPAPPAEPTSATLSTSLFWLYGLWLADQDSKNGGGISVVTSEQPIA